MGTENSRLPYQAMVGKPAGRGTAFGVSACVRRLRHAAAHTGDAVAFCQLDLLRCVDHCREEILLVGEVGAEPLKVRVQRLAVPAPGREEHDERVLASDGRLKAARIQGGDAAAFTQLTELLGGSGADQAGRHGEQHGVRRSTRRAHDVGELTIGSPPPTRLAHYGEIEIEIDSIDAAKGR